MGRLRICKALRLQKQGKLIHIKTKHIHMVSSLRWEKSETEENLGNWQDNWPNKYQAKKF